MMLPSSSELPERPARSVRVLLAEDNPINQRLVRAILEHRGHSLVVVATGREAVAALAAEELDLVLMDLEMREMNGFEATAAIRAREATTGTRVPIIAMTAHHGEEHRRRCRAAGMDGYLAKPVGSRELLAVVEGIDAAPAATEPARHELVPQFVDDAVRLGAAIGDALARRDGEALAAAAHTLRGSAGYFAAGRTHDLAVRLERLARSGDFGEPAAAACTELDAELSRLAGSLAAAGAGIGEETS
jgi:two-component system sensor histidine kinase/response regulator